MEETGKRMVFLDEETKRVMSAVYQKAAEDALKKVVDPFKIPDSCCTICNGKGSIPKRKMNGRLRHVPCECTGKEAKGGKDGE